MKRWHGLIKEYEAYLPVNEATPKLTLNEGGTPLVHLPYLSKLVENEVYAKLEGANPTGSFKDRGMVMAVAKAKEEGKEIVICASTGNTSASAAAYAARAGMKTIVVIPEGKIAMGKLAQAIVYGAEIVSIEGNFDAALNIVRKVSEIRDDIALVNSINPYRLEGQMTAAFEVIEQLGEAPEILAIPVGNAGNISAYWKGFVTYANKHETTLPRMFGFQAEGAAPIVKGHIIDQPETIATAIRIGNPASWQRACAARDESGGMIDSVTDDEIIDAYLLMTRHEGVFAEPGSNASIAGIIKAYKHGNLPKGKKIVAVLTGNGLKDPQTAIDTIDITPQVLKNDEQAIIRYIESVI
ncbi:threonine synthase [Macrococcoides caseolyticum]|uniref:threonine synthase n=1 Tax=Macrococcoides caseolyticum TaxID=69966 RepID=UPI001F3023C7|nr:threonine synthase [Macrococcus caseolyticus]MCE4957187.1 threonine synthase [Macrococcus caseolyticus]